MKLKQAYKEVFQFYSEGGEIDEKTMNFKTIKKITEKIGLKLSEAKLKDEMKKINETNTEEIYYKEFENLFQKRLFKEVSEKDALESYKLFDKEKNGKILIEDFKYIMENLCENMTSEEIEQFLESADQNNDGYIYYKDFVKYLQQ